MSNYCKSCSYNYKTKTDNDSCPFNTLYWNFLDANKPLLEKNHRMRMMYSLLNKMQLKTQDFTKILEKAAAIKLNISDY